MPEVGEPDRTAAARRSTDAIIARHAPELEQQRCTGTRYTNAGIVCMASRTGSQRALEPVAPRRERCRAGSRSRSRCTTATSTWLSVSIAMSHMPSMPIATKHSEQTTASRQRPRDTRQARAAPADDHPPGQLLQEHLASGSSANRSRQSLIVLVTPEKVAWIQSTTRFAASAIETVRAAPGSPAGAAPRGRSRRGDRDQDRRERSAACRRETSAAERAIRRLRCRRSRRLHA